MSTASPAGMPSSSATSAWPCDSPAVKKRSIRAVFYTKFLRHPADRRDWSAWPATHRASVILFTLNDLRAQRRAPAAPAPLLAVPRCVHSPLAALIGSRFQDLGDHTALDLATGDRVWLVRRTLDAIGRAVWPREIDALAALWHPAVAPCLDFGWTSRGEWFEAYAVEGSAERHGGSAAAFLKAHAVNCVLVRREAGRGALPLIPALPDDPGAVRLASDGRGM